MGFLMELLIGFLIDGDTAVLPGSASSMVGFLVGFLVCAS